MIVCLQRFGAIYLFVICLRNNDGKKMENNLIEKFQSHSEKPLNSVNQI